MKAWFCTCQCFTELQRLDSASSSSLCSSHFTPSLLLCTAGNPEASLHEGRSTVCKNTENHLERWNTGDVLLHGVLYLLRRTDLRTLWKKKKKFPLSSSHFLLVLLAEALLCTDIAHFTSTIKKSAVLQSIENFLKQLSSILAGGRWKENDTHLAVQIDFTALRMTVLVSSILRATLTRCIGSAWDFTVL